jgi:Tfp pilus assembly protein PilX
MANQPTNRTTSRPARRTHGERGVALFFTIFALLLLSAIAAALILSSSTDTAINGNYRSEEVAYFGAKSGVEEVRDRMMASNPNVSIPVTYAADMPTTAASPQLYVLNEGNNPGTVQPWKLGNAYMDDELCHDGYPYAGLTSVTSDLRCTTLPSAAGWYNTITSTAPWNGTAAALPYKWARLGLKLDGSEQNYIADNNSANKGNLVCWNGVAEQVLPSAQVQNVASCTTAFSPADNPVYLVTALGIAPNGARKVIQAEIALSPTSPFPYGLFATSTACPSITFNGNNASTDSYTTAAGGTYATTKSGTGGDVGSNGGVSVGNGNVGGIVGALQPPPAGNGTCATPVSIGAQGKMGGTVACPSGNAAACYVPTPYTFPTPPAPNPPTPNTTYSGGNSLVAGTYGNISITGNTTITLAPGTYNINSISMAGKGQINVSPPGAVTINIGGCGDATCSAANQLASPLSVGGNGITDDTIPNDFTINYGGKGAISVAGNGNVTAILNAPNAAVTQVGNGNWYGALLVSSISISGNAFFHYDRNAALSPQSNGYYTMISYREVSY